MACRHGTSLTQHLRPLDAPHAPVVGAPVEPVAAPTPLHAQRHRPCQSNPARFLQPLYAKPIMAADWGCNAARLITGAGCHLTREHPQTEGRTQASQQQMCLVHHLKEAESSTHATYASQDMQRTTFALGSVCALPLYHFRAPQHGKNLQGEQQQMR